jgi:hypothetical protein
VPAGVRGGPDGTGGVPPGPDPAGHSDVVHQSDRTRVTRLFLPGQTVIRKEPLGPDADGRLRHERAMLERLRGVEGVAQLAEAPQYPVSIMIEDVGGASLAGLAKPLALRAWPGWRWTLAQAVIFAGFTMFDFQRLRTSTDITAAPLLAASIFLDVLNAFLFFLDIFSGEGR